VHAFLASLYERALFASIRLVMQLAISFLLIIDGLVRSTASACEPASTMPITAILGRQFIDAPPESTALFAGEYGACARARKLTKPQTIVGLTPTSILRCDAFPGRAGGIPLFFAA